jgi:hypothetical protein
MGPLAALPEAEPDEEGCGEVASLSGLLLAPHAARSSAAMPIPAPMSDCLIFIEENLSI